jgi:hypothetical protein
VQTPVVEIILADVNLGEDFVRLQFQEQSLRPHEAQFAVLEVQPFQAL